MSKTGFVTDASEDYEKTQISECIYNLIPVKELKLRALYVYFADLNEVDRIEFDTLAENKLSSDYLELYRLLKSALTVWDEVQNTEGAPGCEESLIDATKDTKLLTELHYLIMSLETLLRQWLRWRRLQHTSRRTK